MLLLGSALCLVFHLTWMIPLAFAEAPGTRSAGIQIKVRANNHVTANRILLKDIADISADPFLKQSIEQIDISASPDPDRIVSMGKSRIVHLIKAQRFLPDDLVLTCPETIYIKRLGQTIDRQRIKAFVTDQIAKGLRHKTFKLEQLKIKGLEPYPQGRVSFSTDVEKLVGNKGRIASFLDIIVDNVRVDRLNISGKLAVYDDLFFASRTLPKGIPLDREDFYVKKVNVFDFNYPVVQSFDLVEGKLLKTGLKKDNCLKTSILADPPLVRKGDIITLVASRHQLKIVTRGISKQDGFENDVIKVENLHSGKLVRGIVKEKSKVEVSY